MKMNKNELENKVGVKKVIIGLAAYQGTTIIGDVFVPIKNIAEEYDNDKAVNAIKILNNEVEEMKKDSKYISFLDKVYDDYIKEESINNQWQDKWQEVVEHKLTSYDFKDAIDYIKIIKCL